MEDSAVRRGIDWANAGVRAALALGPAALAFLSAAAVGASPVAFGFIVLLVVGLFLGSPWVWLAWEGAVTSATLRVGEEEVCGRTTWPVRRWRSVHLDRLARVGYRKTYGRDGGAQHYIALRDEHGGRLMAVFFTHDPPASLCAAVLRALDRSPSARASRLTRHRLAGGADPRRAGCLQAVLLFAWVLAIVAVAGLAMAALGGP